MITINLLPEELRPIKRTPIPYIASAMVVASVVMGMVFMYGTIALKISSEKSDLATNQTQLNILKPVVEESNALTAKKEQLAVQVRTIDEIARDRIIWSKQLHNLNRLALENQWYNGIMVDTKAFTESRSVYNPNTKKNEQKIEKVEKQVLTLTGYVVPGENGQSSISPFTLATESDAEFSELFQLDLSTFKDTEFDNTSVREFKLEYIVNSGGNDQ